MGVKEFYEKVYKNEYNLAEKKSSPNKKLKKFSLDRDDLIVKNIPKGNKLLEIGCGEGDLLIRLKNKYRILYGIEIAKTRIDRANKKVKNKKIYIKFGDANQKLQFKDNFFDSIIASDVLEHLFDPYHFMKECKRMLKQNGTLVVHTPNVAFFPNRFRLFFGKLPITSKGYGWDGGHLHYFTKSSLKKMFEDEGFKVLKITHGGIFYKFRRWWGSLLCGDLMVFGIKK